MTRFLARPVLALLGALLCLAACAPTATVSVSSTAPATTPAALHATPTSMLAPTPATIPAGWQVLATTHFSLAYPPDWTLQTLSDDQAYALFAPAKQAAVTVNAILRADVTPYCKPETEGAHPTTFANLPMTFQLSGLGNSVRVWQFINARQTRYLLSTGDMAADAATQARDTAILATFRPDNATPWSC